jgi:hypothetical protein
VIFPSLSVVALSAFAPTQEAAATLPLRRVNTTGAIDAAPRTKRRRLRFKAVGAHSGAASPSLGYFDLSILGGICKKHAYSEKSIDGQEKGTIIKALRATIRQRV